MTARALPALLLGLLLCAFATQAAQEVEAKGFGQTHELALKDATRNAVEQTVGIVIGSETLVQNFALVSDKILSQSLGYVTGYELLSEKQAVDGEWEVSIRAQVSEIVDSIVQDKLATRFLLDAMNKPRVMVLLAEKNLDDSESTIAETAVTSTLLDLGFDVVDRNAVDWSQARSVIETFGQIDRDRMAAIVSSAQADLIFAGRASSTLGQANAALAGAGISSVQAVLSGRLYQSETGKVLAVHQSDATKAHINPNVAGAAALEEAADKVAREVLSDVLQQWASLQTQAFSVDLEVKGMGFRHQAEFLAHLRGQSIVKSVVDRGFSDGSFRLVVELEGRSRDLAALLDGYRSGESTWSVESLGDSRLVLATE